MIEKIERALSQAQTQSDDPDTQVGAVLVNARGTIEIIASNHSTMLLDIEDGMLERPEKYDWIEHAERNAIFFAAFHGVQTRGMTLYVTGFPCVECARAIVQSGIKTVYHGSTEGFANVAQYKFDKAHKILTDGQVKLITHDIKEHHEK